MTRWITLPTLLLAASCAAMDARPAPSKPEAAPGAEQAQRGAIEPPPNQRPNLAPDMPLP
jgi:hypothetical protein